MIPNPAIKTTECTLSAAANLAEDILHLRYELTNNTGLPVYLFNKLARTGGTSVFDTAPNTVNIVRHANSVVVGKALVPVPDDMEVERLYTPCMSRVEPGQTLMETLALPHPLVPFTWYKSRPLAKAPVSVPLFFELGYVLASEQAEQLIRVLHTPHGKVYHASWFPLELQKKINTGPLLDVQVFSAR
jgi:hypothetical protein